MKNSLKRLCSLLLMAMLVVPVICVLPVQAKAQGELLVDDADLLDSFDEDTVLEALEKASDTWNIDVAVLTVDSMDGEDAQTFTDDYYDEHGYAEDGVLLMVCMDERQYYISTSGTLINALTDDGIDYIGSCVAQNLSGEEYADAFTEYADLVSDFVEEYEEDGEAYDRDNLPDSEDYDFDYEEDSEGGFHILYLLISLIAGCIISFLIMNVYKGQVRNVHHRGNAGDYLKQDSVSIYTRHDRFLYRNINRTPIPKDRDMNRGGGGSSIHMSGGGHSHGGGGGSF